MITSPLRQADKNPSLNTEVRRNAALLVLPIGAGSYTYFSFNPSPTPINSSLIKTNQTIPESERIALSAEAVHDLGAYNDGVSTGQVGKCRLTRLDEFWAHRKEATSQGTGA